MLLILTQLQAFYGKNMILKFLKNVKVPILNIKIKILLIGSHKATKQRFNIIFIFIFSLNNITLFFMRYDFNNLIRYHVIGLILFLVGIINV